MVVCLASLANGAGGLSAAERRGGESAARGGERTALKSPRAARSRSTATATATPLNLPLCTPPPLVTRATDRPRRGMGEGPDESPKDSEPSDLAAIRWLLQRSAAQCSRCGWTGHECSPRV